MKLDLMSCQSFSAKMFKMSASSIPSSAHVAQCWKLAQDDAGATAMAASCCFNSPDVEHRNSSTPVFVVNVYLCCDLSLKCTMNFRLTTIALEGRASFVISP